MNITKVNFLDYKAVRKSGRTNMFDVRDLAVGDIVIVNTEKRVCVGFVSSIHKDGIYISGYKKKEQKFKYQRIGRRIAYNDVISICKIENYELQELAYDHDLYVQSQ